MNRRTLSVVGAVALFGAASEAHHSIQAIYDGAQRLTVEGVVAEFQFVNPHPIVVIDVRTGGGTTERWRLEMDNRLELVQIGFTRETLKPGDRIVVVGNPARRQANGLYIRRLDRQSDGFWYEQVGATPRIRSRAAGERNHTDGPST